MAVELTGTPVAVTWASGINPAGQSISVPADATAVYMFWTFWASGTGYGLASATLNGNSPNQTLEVATNGDAPAAGVAAWYNPATGSRTLDVAWDTAPSEGPTTIVVFVKGGDTTAWRDADKAQGIGANAVSVTIDSNSTDLVLKSDERYDGSTVTYPSTSTGWTSRQTHGNVYDMMRVSQCNTPGSSSTVCNSEDEYYSTVVAVSIPVAAAGAGHPTAKRHGGVPFQRLNRGVW